MARAIPISPFFLIPMLGIFIYGLGFTPIRPAQASPDPTPTPTRQTGKLIGQGTTKPTITLSAPQGGWTVDRMALVEGKVSDPTVNPITVSINGDRYLLRTQNGEFKRKFPVASGKNTISVQATNQGGTAQIARTLYAQIPAVPLTLIQTSDTDGVYTDLHVYEPSPKIKDPFIDTTEPYKNIAHVFWAKTSSPSGGRFYLNEQAGSYDSPGYGPYLYTHTSPPLGIYRIDANYWPGGDKAHTLATLNIVLFGGTPDEIRRTVKLPLVMPGETQTLAWIRIDRGQKGAVFCPTVDAKPSDPKLWPKWVLHYDPKKAPHDVIEDSI